MSVDKCSRSIDPCQYVEVTDPVDICCAPVGDGSLDADAAADLAQVLKALADPVRLRLLDIVASCGEACACDLTEPVAKSQPTVSHHLSVLVDAGVLTREQRGRWAWFTVVPERLAQVRAALGG